MTSRSVEKALEAAVVTRRLFGRPGFEGLEPNALQVLLELVREPHRGAAEVARALALREATARKAMAALEDRGLVEEARDHATSDGRMRLRTPTPAGRELAQRFDEHARRVLSERRRPTSA